MYGYFGSSQVGKNDCVLSHLWIHPDAQTGSSSPLSLSLSLSLLSLFSLSFPLSFSFSPSSTIVFRNRTMNNDTQTIFSEFSDPYRRSLIDRICAGLVRYKVQIPRVKALGLWFADIEALEALERDPGRLDFLLGDFSEYDLPRICAYSRSLPRPCIIELIFFIQLGASDGQASRVDRRSDTVDVSSGRPGRGDRGRSGSPAQASAAVRSRSEIRIPPPKGSDGRRKRIAGDPVSLSGVFIVESC